MATDQAVSYDSELQRHNAVLRQAIGAQPHDHVLDVGCGTGQTTRQAARTASADALGVDISAPAIRLARELARAEGVDEVTFERADAEVHPFPPERFDLAISRFGTMFFTNPVNGFANIARALRPGGRLVMMVWQARQRNEWAVAVRRALEAVEGPVDGAAGAPDAFSLADPAAVTQTLQAAGFAGVVFEEVHEPVYYGPDVAAALDWVSSFTSTSDVQKQRDPAAADRAQARLRELLAAHQGDDGVWFDSRAWIVTAHRR